MANQTINANYSTTRRLCNVKPQLQQLLNAKYERLFFLPPALQRTGEGGLRRQGYFKASGSNRDNDNKNPLITIITVVFNE